LYGERILGREKYFERRLEMKLCRVSEGVYAESIQKGHETFKKFPQRMEFVDKRLREAFDFDNASFSNVGDVGTLVDMIVGIKDFAAADCYLTDNPYIGWVLAMRHRPFVFDYIDMYSLMVAKEFPKDDEKYCFTRYCETVSIRNCLGLIVQSGDLEKQLSYIETEIKVIPNGVDTKRFVNIKGFLKDKKKFRLVFVGKITDWYASLRTICKAVEGLEDVELVVVGDGGLRESIQKDSPKNVLWMGAKPYDEVPMWIDSADVCVFCVDDGSPLAITEYLCCGKPIITLKGKIEWLLKSGVNGLLVYDTPDEFKQAIITLKENEQLRKQYGEANLELSRRLDWDVLMKEYVQFIKERSGNV
jgi:glycosyltransferase involved in cell wall biosynthesis